MIKLSVVLALMTLMLRFDMIYSIYLFIFLFPYPSSISLGSTNSILATLIALIWSVRAFSEKIRFFEKTEIDKYILLLIIAYILSLYNVEGIQEIKEGLVAIWRVIAAAIFYYMIVRFVTDEKKLLNVTRIICFAGGILFFISVIELFFPTATIIPGWISVGHRLHEGGLGYRLEGLRLQGAVKSHGTLSDFGTVMVFFMVFHFLRAKNPIWKVFWTLISSMTFVIMMATANRGAIFGFLLGIIYFLILFRKRMSLMKYVVFLSLLVAAITAGQLFLDKYTIAASVTDRVLGTRFKGVIPDTRSGVWGPSLRGATEHIIIGHGPVFYPGRRTTPRYWPHNAYLFYLYTVGLVGLTAFLLILNRIIRQSLLFKKKFLAGTTLGTLATILHIQLVMLLFEQLRTDHQRDDIYVYFVWMIFGLITAASNLIKKRKEEEALPEPAT